MGWLDCSRPMWS